MAGSTVVGNRLEQDIVAIYTRDITALHSINQIASLLGKRYPHIYRKVNELITAGVIRRTVVGRSHLCSIALDSDRAIWMMVLNEIKAAEHELVESKHLAETVTRIRALSRTIPIRLALHVNRRIIIVIDDSVDAQSAERIAVARPYHLEVLSGSAFERMLLADRQVMDEHIVLFGYEEYYRRLADIEDRLRMRYSRVPV